MSSSMLPALQSAIEARSRPNRLMIKAGTGEKVVDAGKKVTEVKEEDEEEEENSEKKDKGAAETTDCGNQTLDPRPVVVADQH